MKNLIFLIFLVSVNSFSQKNLEQLLKKYNTESVPYIYATDLQKEKPFNSAHDDDIIILDAREPKEFEVSHLKNAMCVGYDFFNLENTLAKLPKDKNTKIVVYCSLGIRSEDIAEQLQKEGYTNVFNLYGGIFEWKNQGNTIVNRQNKPTEKVHAFSKEWSKWLHKGEKIYE